MKIKSLLVTLSALFIAATLTGCGSIPFLSTPTSTPLPTNTPLPTATPTATPVPYYVTASVMSGTIQAPAILYHRFTNDTHDATSTYTRYSDFKKELQSLYDAGYSLVSMSSWLDGTFSVPEGRKPLLFTLDDGISSDQLYINSDGTPSQYSGLGILYDFSKQNPDFGYAASIYTNMGDKYYGDIFANNWFYVSEGDAWKTKLANTIVWAIENNIELYNHTYSHVDLSLTKATDISYQLQKNDATERDFLALVNRSDLDTKLGNILALPWGNWPASQEGVDAIKNYVNPEGKPLSAIMEAYNADEPKLTPSVFSSDFNKWSLPRITATVTSVEWIVSHSNEIPSMQSCKLGPTEESKASDATTLQALITSAVQAKTCPEGVYHVGDQIFVAQNGTVTPYNKATTVSATPTSTPTAQ
jgi:hypothetical protein